MENKETRTHWKKLTNPDYLGAYSLEPKEERVLTIKSVYRDKVIGPGGKKEDCTVCTFMENSKPMILNRLNCKTISRIYGTAYIEEWEGKKIQIFAEMVKAFGEDVEALRIRPFVPNVALPFLTEEMKAYPKAKKHIEDGGSIDDILKVYQLSDETKKKLTNA